MFAGFSDPFEALLTLQRALDARIASDWMGRGTAAIGSFPPINIFQKGDDYVAIIELPGIDKNDLEIEAKENTIRVRGKRPLPMASKRAFTVASVSLVFLTALCPFQFESNLIVS